MESSVWGLRPQSSSEQWKDHLNGSLYISSSKKPHFRCFIILVPSPTFPCAFLGYRGRWVISVLQVSTESIWWTLCPQSLLVGTQQVLPNNRPSEWKNEWIESVLPGVSFQMLRLRERPGGYAWDARKSDLGDLLKSAVGSWEFEGMMQHLQVPWVTLFLEAIPRSTKEPSVLEPRDVHYTISKLYFVGGAGRAESQILPFFAEKGGLKMKHRKPLGVGTQIYIKRNFPLHCYHPWRRPWNFHSQLRSAMASSAELLLCAALVPGPGPVHIH